MVNSLLVKELAHSEIVLFCADAGRPAKAKVPAVIENTAMNKWSIDFGVYTIIFSLARDIQPRRSQQLLEGVSNATNLLYAAFFKLLVIKVELTLHGKGVDK